MTQIGLVMSGSAASPQSPPPSGAPSLGVLPCPVTEGAAGGCLCLCWGHISSNPKERALPPKGGIGILDKSQITLISF